MKNIVKFFTVMIIILSTSLSIFASNSIIINKENDIDVIFGEDTVFTDSQKANIINHFTNQTNTIATYSILCLFGHNLTISGVETEQHKYYATSPRCILNTYDVSSCSRCDYVSSKLISSIRIPCCS